MKLAASATEAEARPFRLNTLLQGKIAALRRRRLAVAGCTGIAMAWVIGIELLALAMFLDWWLDLPWAVRLVSLAGQTAVAGWILARQVIRPLVMQPDEDELALMMERARPEFRTRLIASLQLCRPGALSYGASPGLVHALVEQTEAIAGPMDFADIVPSEKLRKFGALAVVIGVLAVAGFLAGGQATAELFQRVFLRNVAVPRKTRVLVPVGDHRIGLGDSVRIEAFAQGVIPAAGRLRLEYRSRRRQELPLERDKEEAAHFGRTIENVQETFRYRIYLNDGVSPAYTVTAVPRPTVATIRCEQEYPPYARLKPMRRSLGDLSLLAGSKLKLAITATKPIRSALLRLTGFTNANEVSLRVSQEEPKELTGELAIPAENLNGFQVQLLDTEGMESRDSAVYRVEIIPDKAPVVRITYPERKEELVTRRARLLVAFDAIDDFQIARAFIRYVILGPEATAGTQATPNTVELELAGEQPERLRRRFEWKLGDLPLVEGSVIEYWVEAEDNNDATGPGLGTSDHQLARVVSESEKRADLLNRAGDYMGSIGDAASDQERLNRSLGAIILEKTGPR